MTELGERWPIHLCLAAAAATATCLFDLATKWGATGAAVATLRFHDRPTAELLPFVVIVAALLVTTSLAGSPALDLAAGLVAGGAFGNIASAFLWRRGIPDFIPAHGSLLNVGDVAMAVGVAGLVAVSLLLARRELAPR